MNIQSGGSNRSSSASVLIYASPLLVIGVVLGAKWIEAYRRQFVMFRLTDRGIIIVSEMIFRDARSFPLLPLADISFAARADGSDTITLGRPPSPFAGLTRRYRSPDTPELELTPDVARVFTMIEEAQAALANRVR